MPGQPIEFSEAHREIADQLDSYLSAIKDTETAISRRDAQHP